MFCRHALVLALSNLVKTKKKWTFLCSQTNFTPFSGFSILQDPCLKQAWEAFVSEKWAFRVGWECDRYVEPWYDDPPEAVEPAAFSRNKLLHAVDK